MDATGAVETLKRTCQMEMKGQEAIWASGVEMGGIERNRKRQSDGNDSRMDGRQGWMDGAASCARYSSKRAGMRLLAGYQHRWYEHNTSDVPGLSTPPPYHPRRSHTILAHHVAEED